MTKNNLFPDLNPRSMAKEIKSLADAMKLFTVMNPKMLKGRKKGYMPIVLMLAPAYLSGWEVCPFRSPGCTRACLNTAGHGGIVKGGAVSPEQVIEISNRVQNARLHRTNWLFSKTRTPYTDAPNMPVDFGDAMVKDINRLLAWCLKHNLTPCVRLNGTSDLRWENMIVPPRQNIFTIFPDTQFYDYTKQPWRNRKNIPTNYHLTYSLTEQPISGRRMKEYFNAGINTAVVFQVARNRPLPSIYASRRVIDGDEYDMRFLDPRGIIVGLRAKGFAQDDTTGFVIDPYPDRENPKQLTFHGGDLFPDIP